MTRPKDLIYAVDGGAEKLVAAMQSTIMNVRGRDISD